MFVKFELLKRFFFLLFCNKNEINEISSEKINDFHWRFTVLGVCWNDKFIWKKIGKHLFLKFFNLHKLWKFSTEKSLVYAYTFSVQFIGWNISSIMKWWHFWGWWIIERQKERILWWQMGWEKEFILIFKFLWDKINFSMKN